MSKAITTSNLFNHLNRFNVGYEPLFKQFEQTVGRANQNYPPYNMYAETDDRMVIEVAIAGFHESELEVEQDQNRLTVTGKRVKNEDEEPIEYQHKGISDKSFTLDWNLAEHVDVKSALIDRGILVILLEREVPEDKKPKTIPIG